MDFEPLSEEQRNEIAQQLDAMHEELRQKGIHVSPCGHEYLEEGLESYEELRESGNLNDIHGVYLAMQDIEETLEPAKTEFVWTTYTTKHRIASYIKMITKEDHYYTNGDFICALILLGYKIKWQDQRLNPTFCAKPKTKDIKKGLQNAPNS